MANKKRKPDEGKQNLFEGAKAGYLSVYRTYKGEFKKIVWPSRPELIRQTFTVIVISLLFGAYIALADGVLGMAFTSFVNAIQ